MKNPLSRVLTILVVAALLLCSVTVAACIFHESAMVTKIADVQTNLNAVQGRLRKQQQEFAEYQALLPQVEAELAALQPQADEAFAKEQALRQQRKDLRAENAALADELTVLLAQADEASADALLTAQALDHLADALASLNNLYGLE